MLLKSVSSYGFKSFADKIELTFGPGITAVVGPNGSGKSNISDAIRWVLGEQSAKYLRGSKMEDVIFSGTSKRRPLGVAEVNLTFDNSDKRLPLDYEEVCITRRVFRSGDSEYAINKKSCRLKDVVDLLADTGLGRGSMAIIGQNKIDEILNSRPEDRRAIFEEAAGIAKYRMRKREAARRLNDTANNLTRINDIKAEVQSQVEPLRIESEKTREYNRLNEQLRSCRLTQFVRKVETIEEARTRLRQAQEEVNRALLEKNTGVAAQEATCSGLQLQLDKLSDEYNRLQEGIKEKETSLEKLKGMDAVLNERMEQSEKNSARLEERNERLQQQINQWEEQQQLLAEEYDRQEKAKNEAVALVEHLTEAKAAREKAVAEGEAQISELTNSNFDAMAQMVELRNAIRELERDQEQRMRRREALKNTIEEIEAKVAGLKEEQQQLNQEQAAINRTIEQYISEGKEQRAKQEAEQKSLSEVQTKYNGCQNRITALESRLHILENMQKTYDGFGYGIKTVLQSTEKWRSNVLGAVAELLQVQPEYVVAVETALGAGAQNLVVTTSEAAKQAISYLKTKHSGRATFLPLDTIRQPYLKPEEAALAKLPGIVGFGSDLVSCSEEIAPAVRFLLGRVLIAENMDAALAAAKRSNYRLRAVTLEGDVVNAGGSMTGGSRQQKESGFLSRGKELQEQQVNLQALQQELLGYQEQIEALEDTVNALERKLEALRGNVQAKQIRLTEINSSLEHLQELVTQENEHLELSLGDRNKITQEYMEAREVLGGKRPELQTLEAANQRSKEALDGMQRQIAADRSALNTLQTRLQDAKVQVEGNTARSDATAQRMKQLDTDMGRLQDDLGNNENEIEHLQRVITDSRAEKEGLEDKTKEVMSQLADIMSGKEDFGAKRLELTEQHAVENERLQTLRREQVKLEGRVRQGEIDNAKLDSDYENALAQLSDDYKLTLEEAKASGLLRDQGDAALHRSELQYQRDIEALGPINMGAIEQYAAISSRFEFLQKQYTDLCEAKDNLESIIGEINSGMSKKFKAAFAKINEYFAATYVELFGGGTALLKLTDPEDILESGIDIEVQPPGKRLQSLFLLSGGERALTVIALLFALLSYQPAPFCILDEIDAPLDDANIGRFARFLKSYSANSQFIVITHRKGTMESANILYGVTMEESGVSKLLSVTMSEKE